MGFKNDMELHRANDALVIDASQINVTPIIGGQSMARLSIEVSEVEHHKIKALAALSGKTIRQFILDKVFGTKEPNCETLRAFRDIEQGKNLTRYETVDALMEGLKG